MILRLFFALALLFATQLAYAERRKLYVVDIETGKGITNALVSNPEGKLLGLTDTLGIVEMPRGLCMVSHVGYMPEESSADTIRLRPLTRVLPDASVVSRMPDYACLTSLIRVYQYVDSVPVNYAEGIVDFYINTRKHKLSYVIESLRVYRDKKLLRDTEMSKGGFDVSSNGLYDWLRNAYISADEDAEYRIVEDDGRPMIYKGVEPYPAHLIEQGDQVDISLDLLGADEGRELKLMGRKTRIVRNELYQSYPKAKLYVARPYDMLAYRLLVELDSSYKGGDVRRVQNVTEIYALDLKFVTSEVYKTIKVNSYWGSFGRSIAPYIYDEFLGQKEWQAKVPMREPSIARRLGSDLLLLE